MTPVSGPMTCDSQEMTFRTITVTIKEAALEWPNGRDARDTV